MYLDGPVDSYTNRNLWCFSVEIDPGNGNNVMGIDLLPSKFVKNAKYLNMMSI